MGALSAALVDPFDPFDPFEPFARWLAAGASLVYKSASSPINRLWIPINVDPSGDYRLGILKSLKMLVIIRIKSGVSQSLTRLFPLSVTFSVFFARLEAPPKTRK